MIDPDLKIPQSELSGRLQKLMFLRVLIVSFLLGASVFLQVKETQTYFGDIQTFHYLFITAIYVLTFVYIVLLKRQKNLSKLAYSQLLMDTVLITAIIYATGGIESIFSFLYILTIINASIMLYRKGGMIIASSSSILYGGLLDLHYFNLIEPFGSRLALFPLEDQRFYIFYMIVVNIAAFYLVAFLSSYLSEQTRKSRVELKAKQHDFIQLEALNERIIRSIMSGLITLDDQNRVILFNPAAEDIFAVKSDQAIGRKMTDMLPLLDENLGDGKGPSGQLGKNPHQFIDLPYLRGDGERIFLRFSISPLRLPDGDQKGRILFFQDMTEVKRIEEEMKKVEGLALIGELAAGIAHEIRNPMASISGSIQMLKEGLDKDDVNSRLMDIMLREVTRLNHLINDFLLFARPKPLDLQEFDLSQLTTESLELFKNSGNWTGQLRVETNFKRDIMLESDPEQIKQVLWNLFLNASEAMPNGGVVRVSADLVESRDASEPGQKMVKISVKDSGQGFSKKALSHLFTPFFTTKEGGSGLGLATVKRIVEGLKGKVHGENHPEGGAEITILLHPSPSLSA
jgi:two-component system sensor histidine kinase PilS (NtrC family)